MTTPNDQPFRSKAEREREKALLAQYRQLGNSELLDALKQQQQAIERDRRAPQQR